MGMDGHPELLRRALDELGEDALGDQVGDVRPYGVHPEDEVGLGVGHDLEETVWLPLDERLADGPEGELGLLDHVALLLCLGLGEPERGDLGTAEGNARDEVLVHGHRVLAGHVLDGDDPLVPRGVGEPVASDDVPGSVDSVLAGPSELVDLDNPVVVELYVCHVEVQVLGDGPTPDRHQDSLGLEGLSLVGLAGRRVLAAVGAAFAFRLLLFARASACHRDLDATVGLLQALRVGLRAREHPDAAVFELLLEGLRDLRVLQGHYAVEQLDHRDVGPEVVVHAGELDADGARAEDYDGPRIVLVVGHDVVRGDNLLAVELQSRQGADGGAGGDQDVLRLELLLAVFCLHLYLLGLDKTAYPVVDGYLVLLHQALHAAPELVDDLLAALGSLRVVELHLSDVDPVVFTVSGVVQKMGRLEQCFGRDASHVQACASEMPALPLIDQGYAHSELAGPDRRYVSTVPAADYYEVETLRHLLAPFVSGFRFQVSGLFLLKPRYSNSNCPSPPEPFSVWHAGQ